MIKKTRNCHLTPIVIPQLPKNREYQRIYDKEFYKLTRLIEKAFLHLKLWRAIPKRYAKNAPSFFSAIKIRCISIFDVKYGDYTIYNDFLRQRPFFAEQKQPKYNFISCHYSALGSSPGQSLMAILPRNIYERPCKTFWMVSIFI